MSRPPSTPSSPTSTPSSSTSSLSPPATLAFDPINPGSQLLTRPARASSPTSPSGLPPRFNRSIGGKPSSPSRLMTSSVPVLQSARRATPSGGSSSGRQSDGEGGSARGRQRDWTATGSKSTFVGGANQTFMQLINALALEEASGTFDAHSDSEASPPSSPRPHTSPPIDGALPSFSPISTPDSSDDEEDDDPPLPPSATALAALTASSSSTSGASSSNNDEPPSFLSPSSQPTSPSRPARTPPYAMVSSLYAIHRPPIGSRRRTDDAAALEEEDPVEDEGKEEVEEQAVPLTEGDASVSTEDKAEQRKRLLASKLEDVFGLKEAEEVLAEYPCWLFRSVLLQGFVYLTTGHICFYAYLPSREGATLRSGSISLRSTKTRMYNKYWFILKDAVLSWYPSSTDPYFPLSHIDLHYVTSVYPSSASPCRFKIATTGGKVHHLSCASEVDRDEWMKVVKKEVFRCRNEGESVKIAIPLETICSISLSTHLEFAETIRIVVTDPTEGYSTDEYWLAYFSDLHGALARLQEGLVDWRERKGVSGPPEGEELEKVVVDTNVGTGSKEKGKEKDKKETWGATISSRLRLFPSSSSPSTPLAPSSPTAITQPLPEHLEASSATLRSTTPLPRPPPPPTSIDHRYPPEPSSTVTPPSSILAATSIQPSSWTHTLAGALPPVPLPSWLRSAASSAVAPFAGAPGMRRIVEIVDDRREGRSSSSSRGRTAGRKARNDDLSRSVWDDAAERPDEEEEDEDRGEKEVDERFRKAFGVTEKEVVVAHFPGYLFRGLPIYGKLYISTSFLCFKSGGYLAKTKMILPLSDIIGLSKHRSYRIGYSGLIIVIKGHEEVFFELSTSQRRDDCMAVLEHQVELVRQQLAEGNTIGDASTEQQNHLDLLDLAAQRAAAAAPTSPSSTSSSAVLGASAHQQHPFISTSLSSSNLSSAARPPPAPVMFCSTSSDFVTFRPERSLRFTCLTVGSRGDVQPYIALCKGLMAEGHTCKIASHGEYRAWVEGHGIAFEEVGGDPAELMQLMIAHDFFTIAFMKEAVGRFRGWLDDLLETTWKACQGCDVLIESPSAIAGYHIAEALRIPYYRAFTMPWSRTRAYPHAFAVPDSKMGGGYNYMTYTMFDQIFWRATAGQINRWRKKTLGLRSTNLEQMQQHKIPFLYNFSPVIIPPPLDWRENIHVTGYWWLDNPDDSTASKWVPPPALLAFLDLAKERGKKVVFIGFGSIIIPDPGEMTRVVAEAVEKSGVYAIVAKGWSDRALGGGAAPAEERNADGEEEEERLMGRENIFKVKSIPHDWLFPRIDAAVHHGGAGTTGASLRAGLPTVIKPFFGDQHFYADRVATLGIGSAVRQLSVDNLTEAIVKAVTDEKQIARAKAAGEAIRKEDGVGNAIESIYRDLEYARSLIPPPPSANAATAPSGAPLATPPTAPSDDEGGWDVVSASGGESVKGWEEDDDGSIASGVRSRSVSASREDRRGGSGGSPAAGIEEVLLAQQQQKKEEDK